MSYRLYLRHERHRTLRYLDTFKGAPLALALEFAQRYAGRAKPGWKLYLRPLAR